MDSIRSRRSGSVRPRRSATPNSVMKTPASARAVLTGPDSRLTIRLEVTRGRRQRDNRHSADGSPCRPQEFAAPADRTDVATASGFGVDLAGQVDFDRGVDRNEPVL